MLLIKLGESQENIFEQEKSYNTKPIESEVTKEFSPDQFKKTAFDGALNLEKDNPTPDPGSKTEGFQ